MTTTATEEAPRSVHRRIIDVLADLPAIGKNQRNQQQGFNFRGIDDVLDELNPLLAKHGVFFVPEVLERLESTRETRSGGTLWVTNLHVRYTFYGEAGESVVAGGRGEGTDSGDKATQKAMTGAMKYVLFQVFAIATHDARDDSDRETPEASSPTRALAVTEGFASREEMDAEIARAREMAVATDLTEWV